MTSPNPNEDVTPVPVWDGEGDDPWLPARLQALLDAGRAERSLYEVIWDALSSWLVATTRRVLRGPVVDTDAILAQEPAWQDRITQIIIEGILPVMSWAYEGIFGPGYDWRERPNVISYLTGVRNRLSREPQEAFDLVAGQIAAGVTLGEGMPELRDRVDEVLSTTKSARWKNRAVVIARTESLGALNGSRADAFQAFAEEGGEDMERMWLCVRGDTPVAALGVLGAARRYYEGPLVSLVTASRARISITPEHKVLTERGWIPAKLLNQGDQLFRVFGVDSSGAPSVQDEPTTIGEIVDAVMASESVEVRTVSRRMNLDGNPINGDVDVVGADGGLLNRVESRVSEYVKDLFLVHADLLRDSPLFGHGRGLDRLAGLDSTLESKSSLGAPGDLFLDSFAGGAQDSGSALVSQGDPELIEYSDDRGAGAGVFSGEGLHGIAREVLSCDLCRRDIVTFTGGGCDSLSSPGLLDSLGALEVPPGCICSREKLSTLPQSPPDGLGTPAEVSGDLSGGLPALVTADYIVDIETHWFSGHVYDLSTKSEWFTGDGLIIHNSTIDSRTRPSHVLADGQRVGLTEPFIVGGAPLMFPGDPSGPAGEVISCRCTTLLLEKGENVDMSRRQLRRR